MAKKQIKDTAIYTFGHTSQDSYVTTFIFQITDREDKGVS